VFPLCNPRRCLEGAITSYRGIEPKGDSIDDTLHGRPHTLEDRFRKVEPVQTVGLGEPVIVLRSPDVDELRVREDRPEDGAEYREEYQEGDRIVYLIDRSISYAYPAPSGLLQRHGAEPAGLVGPSGVSRRV